MKTRARQEDPGRATAAPGPSTRRPKPSAATPPPPAAEHATAPSWTASSMVQNQIARSRGRANPVGAGARTAWKSVDLAFSAGATSHAVFRANAGSTTRCPPAARLRRDRPAKPWPRRAGADRRRRKPPRPPPPRPTARATTGSSAARPPEQHRALHRQHETELPIGEIPDESERHQQHALEQIGVLRVGIGDPEPLAASFRQREQHHAEPERQFPERSRISRQQQPGRQQERRAVVDRDEPRPPPAGQRPVVRREHRPGKQQPIKQQKAALDPERPGRERERGAARRRPAAPLLYMHEKNARNRSCRTSPASSRTEKSARAAAATETRRHPPGTGWRRA